MRSGRGPCDGFCATATTGSPSGLKRKLVSRSPGPSAAEAAALRGQGFDFYDWGVGEARLVTSWNQDMAAVETLARAIEGL